ncbi:uncharacterized protein NMK_2256 [Novimethylophilus kurashikiensis]|uniref:Porin n=1 Tax=Novimethylophilus kurashikiensis TaxID=1825523 RepID=A0A2R5F8Y6_9PROT|nr:outer membrane beta-barrel protein [Novimethylophilus kurashikiensis]GBG14657.1 uncharacterized protein NMK_2256 [Novimethylophilus kurashikiensis]
MSAVRFDKGVGILVLVAGLTPAAWADDYHLGQGYNVGNFNIAGYASVVADAPTHGTSKLMIDDLSLFITGRFNRYFNPFFEGELTEDALWQEGGSLFSDSKPRLVLERLYNDSYLTDYLSVRLGKMLTPIGEWNTIHAAPLVWTTTRPMTTYRGFNEYTSGIAVNYDAQDAKLPEVQLYWQPDGEMIPKPQRLIVREYVHAYGVHANWSLGLTDKIGLSIEHADVNASDESQTLYGLNARKTWGKFQLETEAHYTDLSGGNPSRARSNERGAYVLAAYSPTAQWSVMGRYEYFADREAASSSRNALVGVAYRPDPAMVWKLECVKNYGAVLDIETGVFASFSVLF